MGFGPSYLKEYYNGHMFSENINLNSKVYRKLEKKI